MPNKQRAQSDPGRETADAVKLVPEADFKRVLAKVLTTSKKKSDRQMARFQASNKARREKSHPKK